MEAAASKPTPTSRHASPQRLRVVIADDHHHVLPEIHLTIRRRVLPFTGIHIVHWDAHPDLSFSESIKTSLVFKPQQLYDALDDSASGIAEFLLPLVFAGHVDCVTWIKPPWATQMQAEDTMENIAVGCHKDADRLAVSCSWPHFVDDELYATEAAMDPMTIKRWKLCVTEDPLAVRPLASSSSTPWILDIDLDYFSTWNPFRKDLEELCSPTHVELLTHVFTQPRYRRLSSLLSPTSRSLERQQFLKVMERIRRLPPSELQQHALELADSLAPLYDNDDGKDLSTKECLLAFLRYLGSTDESTRSFIWRAAPCLDLPHHESTEVEIETLLHTFRRFLQASTRPSLVTIATSVSDRFLPPHQLAAVKSRVLVILEEELGPLQVDAIEYEAVEAEAEAL